LEIPGSLEEIIMACLEKEPHKRPQDALELDQRLAEVKLDEHWTGERAEKWWRVHLPEYAKNPISQSMD
jgi:hypothetical protein